MTGKLIKFEFRSCFRPLVIVWAALLAMTIILCVMTALTGAQTIVPASPANLGIIASVVNVVSWIAYVAVFVALVVLTIGIVIVRFYKGLLGDEGYLMHTLPVKEWQLITAKGVAAVCAVIVSIFVAFISILPIAMANDVQGVLSGLAELGGAIASEPILLLFVFEGLIILVLGLLKTVYQIYAAISIGQLANRHRLLASLGAYIGISIVLSIIASLGVGITTNTGLAGPLAAWFDAHSAVITADGMTGLAGSQIVIFLVFLVTAVQLVIFHIISERLLTKHLNLL